MNCLTPAELAAQLGCPERTLRKLALELHLCHVIGKTMFFTEEDVKAILRMNTPKKKKAIALYKQQDALEEAREAANRLAPKAPPGNVYFIRGSNLVKIGFARLVKRRLIALQVSNPFPLELLLSYSGSYKHERELHKRFAQYRSHGEWFRHEGELADYIAMKRGNK